MAIVWWDLMTYATVVGDFMAGSIFIGRRPLAKTVPLMSPVVANIVKKIGVQISIQADGGGSYSADEGFYGYYAGPVYSSDARGRCITATATFQGIRDAARVSIYGYCG